MCVCCFFFFWLSFCLYISRVSVLPISHVYYMWLFQRAHFALCRVRFGCLSFFCLKSHETFLTSSDNPHTRYIPDKMFHHPKCVFCFHCLFVKKLQTLCRVSFKFCHLINGTCVRVKKKTIERMSEKKRKK